MVPSRFLRAGQNHTCVSGSDASADHTPDGRVKFGNSLIHWPTARCFQQFDLYSTFFGTLVNDEIEAGR
jgi:hypothetical protein